MLIDILYIVAGLVLLFGGAEALVRGASSFALRSGLTPLVVGLTVVAVGTGTPELFVSVSGALSGNPGLALGNVVGSNISNVALVLGLAAVVAPMAVRSELVKREMPLMISASVTLPLLMLDGRLGRLDGCVLLVLAVAYTIGAYQNAKRDAQDEASEEFGQEIRMLGSRRLEVVFLIAGLVLLVFGSQLLTKGAVSLAVALGVSSAVIALSIIAVGTSLPELATSVSAARMGQADVAFGNAIGSNTYNILGVLGIVAIIHPFGMGGVRPVDFLVMVAVAGLLVLLMMRGWVLSRLEGLILLVIYAAYLWTLAA